MKRTNTQSLREVLGLYLEENPLLTDKLAETRLLNAWETVLGSLTQQYTSNIYIRNKTLHVSLSSAALKNELIMCREKLISRLNDEAGRKVISEIVFY